MSLTTGLSTCASMPARQRGSTSAGGGNLAALAGIEAPAAGEPLLDGIAQTVMIDAGSAVDGTQEGHALIGGLFAMVSGNAVEAGLDVAAGDGVERTSEPVADVEPLVAAIHFVGGFRASGIGGNVVVDGILECGHGSCLGALSGGIIAACDAAEGFLGEASCLIGGDLAVSTDDDALVGGLSSTVPRPVIDDEGLGAGGMNPQTEACQPVVPCDPGFIFGLEGIDVSLVQGDPELSDAFSRCVAHGVDYMSVMPRFVNTLVNPIKAMHGVICVRP